MGYVVSFKAHGKLVVSWKDFDNKKHSQEFILSDKDFIKGKGDKPSGFYYLSIILKPSGKVYYRLRNPGSR